MTAEPDAIEAARRLLDGVVDRDGADTTAVARAYLSLFSRIEEVRKEEWQPIETAPTDGTDIDVWIANPDCEVGDLRMPNVRWRENKWQSYGEKYGWMPIEKFGALVTHWRLIPPPPSLPYP